MVWNGPWGARLIAVGNRLASAVPDTVGRFLGDRLGDLCLFFLRGYRLRVARRNLSLALPELTAAEALACERSLLRHTGRVFFDTLRFLRLSAADLEPLVEVCGEEHLRRLRDRPVVMIVPHMLGMIIGGYVLVRRNHPLMASYKAKSLDKLRRFLRRPDDRLAERGGFGRYWVFNDGYMLNLKERGAIRDMLRFLRANGILYFLPDIATEKRRSVRSFFMGQPAHTPSALFRMVAGKGVATVICSCVLGADDRYHIHISPPLEDFPTGDARRDAERVNRCLERVVRRHPDQYFWYHRRFKTGKGADAAPDDPYAGL